uniref:Uncharacterized protein n=1 Tax=Arundo donax TaxID=35708 RepID=A0A0A9FA52_ARUDO
MARIWLLNE